MFRLLNLLFASVGMLKLQFYLPNTVQEQKKDRPSILVLVLREDRLGTAIEERVSSLNPLSL